MWCRVDQPHLAVRDYACTTHRYRNIPATVLQVQHANGNLPNLLRVAVEESLNTTLRQVAAIQIKNIVKRGWDPEGERTSTQAETATSQHNNRVVLKLT